MFQLKNNLITTVGNQKIQLVKLNLIIKDVVVIINKFSVKGVNGKIKFILPFVLIGLYLFFTAIIIFFRQEKIIK